jgi:signal transduction histidine kinase
MDPYVAAKAFDPFFTTKDIGQGIGLGLSEVLGVVRQLRGHVTLNSVPGQGSVVTLFLPRAR